MERDEHLGREGRDMALAATRSPGKCWAVERPIFSLAFNAGCFGARGPIQPKHEAAASLHRATDRVGFMYVHVCKYIVSGRCPSWGRGWRPRPPPVAECWLEDLAPDLTRFEPPPTCR